jgi:hypothetical protein
MRSQNNLQHIRCKKKAYKDKAAALAVMHQIQNKDDGKKKPIRAYECEACRKWHITSTPIDNELKTNYRLRLDWSKLIE